MLTGKSKYPVFIILAVAGIITGSVARPLYAHQGHHHPPPEPLTGVEKDLRRVKLARINDDYLKTVKPLFQRSCFDCHSDRTRYPWYYRLPGAQQLIDHDIAESKKHLDLSHDFPFQGHGSPEEDLEAIEGVLSKGSMPPWRYRILHSGTAITGRDQQAVLDWVKRSRLTLKGH